MLGAPDEVGSNDGEALGSSVGVKVGQSEVEGWSVGFLDGDALSDG